MRKLSLIAVGLALVGVTAPATRAQAPTILTENMEYVTTVPFLGASHLEFMERGNRVFALSGSRDPSQGGIRIIEVTDPENPVLISYVKCFQGNNDVQASPAGDKLLVGTHDDGCSIPTPREPGYKPRVGDAGIVDIGPRADGTDGLLTPKLLGTPSAWPDLQRAHSLVFHPTLPVAYLAGQVTPTRSPVMGIVDLRGGFPYAAKTVDALPVGSSPHDITFNADGTRAYVSSITATYVLDTTDVLNPTLVSVIANPLVNIHHEAMLTPNGRYLLISDEQAGAIANPTCPGGGVHVYDMSNELAPVWAGVFFADDVRPASEAPAGDTPVCTAHEGGFDADGNLLAMGWYNAGGRVFDVSALNAPDTPAGSPVGFQVNEVAFARPQAPYTWTARFHRLLPGYVFMHNAAAGLEVYRMTAAL